MDENDECCAGYVMDMNQNCIDETTLCTEENGNKDQYDECCEGYFENSDANCIDY
jgi:hypothetical protein